MYVIPESWFTILVDPRPNARFGLQVNLWTKFSQVTISADCRVMDKSLIKKNTAQVVLKGQFLKKTEGNRYGQIRRLPLHHTHENEVLVLKFLLLLSKRIFLYVENYFDHNFQKKYVLKNFFFLKFFVLNMKTMFLSWWWEFFLKQTDWKLLWDLHT